MHLDEERIERLLHRELPADAAAAAREHLAACAECRAHFAEAEREESEAAALLEALDRPLREASEASWASVVERAERPRSGGSLRRSRRFPSKDAEAIGALWFVRSGWGRAAAVLLLAVGLGGLAYALPGSPLRALVGWVAAVVERIVERPAERPLEPSIAPAPSPSEPPAMPSPPAEESGISVDPGAGLVIVFTSAQPEARVRVSLVDGGDVVVRAPAGSAEFTSDAGRLVIDSRAPAAEYRIRIPRGAPRVEIRVGGRRVFLKDAGRVMVEQGAGAEGEYVIPLGAK